LFSFIDRGGLGRDNHLKRQNEVKKTLLEEKTKKRIKVEQRLREDFRKHMSSKFGDKKIQSDLYKSQKACEQLDKAKVQFCVFLNKFICLLTYVLTHSLTHSLIHSFIHLSLYLFVCLFVYLL